MTTKAPALLIGIGNRLRGDDGAGYRLAQILARRPPPGLQVLARQQLTPELAEPLAAASRVLFVDAVLGGSGHGAELALMPVEPAVAAPPCSHRLTPAQLLGLSQGLYGRCPPAWQLLIPGHGWPISDQLSAATAAACRGALPLLRRWSQGDA